MNLFILYNICDIISLYQLRVEIEMIIMQEYGFLKNEVGEKEWNKMLEFLEAHENYLLSDLIYNRYIFELYEKWKNHA